jgi:predicted ATPase with chaperone activity
MRNLAASASAPTLNDDGTLLDEIAAPEAAGLTLLRDAADALALSARGYHRTLRVARTLADLDGEEKVCRIHIAEALSYRGETLRRAQAAAYDIDFPKFYGARKGASPPC